MHNAKFFLGQNFFFNMEGLRMSPTPDRIGLLMTHSESLYSFHCRSKNSCNWKLEDNRLEIKRKAHIMVSLPIPEYILNGCQYPESNCTQCGDGFWNLTENGCESEFQLFVYIYTIEFAPHHLIPLWFQIIVRKKSQSRYSFP